MRHELTPPSDVDCAPIATISVFQHNRRMTAKFFGSLPELKDWLLPLDLQGEWEKQPHGVWKFRCKTRLACFGRKRKELFGSTVNRPSR
jgi:hypothetical protein